MKVSKQPYAVDNPYIGRIVVLVSPLIAGLAVVIVNAIQDWFGIAVDGTQLTVLLTGVVVGVFGILAKWLDNRGKYEELVQAAKVVKDPQP